MADPSGYISRIVADADIPTPQSGKVHVYFTSAGAKYKDSTGTAFTFSSVSSFNSRTGAIAPIQADYDSFFLTPAEGNAAYDVLGAASAAQAAAIAASQPLNSNLTSISALSTTSFGRSQLILADASAATAQLNLATTALKGLMSTTDKKKFSVTYNADADFGFVGDLVSVFDGAMTNTQNILTCATSAPFTATDVGKRITVAGAGVSGAQLTTTITGFTSSSVVTLGLTAGATVSAKGVSYGTDNTAAINTMVSTVNNAVYGGIRIEFGQSALNSALPASNAYGFPIAVVFNRPIGIFGIGSSFSSDIGDYTKGGGTRLAWWGTTSGSIFGAFITVAPVSGASNQAIYAPIFKDCWLDCRNGDQNQALYGLQLLSCHGYVLDNFFIMDALAVGLDLNVVASLGEARDCTRGIFDNFRSRQLDNPVGAVITPILMTSVVTLSTTPQSLTVASNTLPTSGYIWTVCAAGYPVLVNYTGGGGTTTLTGCTISAGESVNTPATVNGGNIVQAVPGNATCIRLDGDATANSCCSTMLTCELSHGTTWGPAAIEFRNSDSWECANVIINGGNNTNDGAINRIRKPGVRLNGSPVSQTLAARNNTFRAGSAGVGSASAMGVTNTGALLAAATAPNYWDMYSTSNAESIPTRETGAYFDWTPNGGFRPGPVSISAPTAQTAIVNVVTQVNGTLIPVPPQGLQVGTTIRWTMNGLQTPTATASTFVVRLGTAGTTADAAIATSAPTSVAVAATGVRIDVELVVRTIGAGTAGTAYCTFTYYHGTATGGLGGAGSVAIVQATMVAFSTTVAQQFLSISFLSGAAGSSFTPEICYAQCIKPANP